MAYEDIEVRITKSGEIYVKVEGAQEERLRDYFAFLEEAVGPVRSASPVDRKDWERPAGLAAESDEEKQHREQELGA